MWDDLGTPYIDALASLWYCQVGHGRTEIADAVVAQMRQLETFQTLDRYTNRPADTLCTMLASSAPMDGARVFLTSGGSESVDAAMKIARASHVVSGQPERTLIISRTPSYHGVTYGGTSATGLAINKAGFGPLLPDVVQVPWSSLTELDAVLADRGDELAAIIAEPIIGAGGVYTPPPGYLEGLRERASRYGGFLIFDEVITGFGRMGTMWASTYYGVQPDMVTFAKGVTSGYAPVGGVLVGPAVLSRLEADPSFVLRTGHTYSGHAACCAAAIANLELLPPLLARAAPIGERLRSGLSSIVDEVRGDGGMAGITLPDGFTAMDVREELLNRGVIARPIGADILAFCPPLVITDDQIDQIVDAVRDVLT